MKLSLGTQENLLGTYLLWLLNLLKYAYCCKEGNLEKVKYELGEKYKKELLEMVIK